jgi:hypothetical protein
MQTSTLRDLSAPSLAALGIHSQDAAHMLATILQLSRRPVTLLLRDLAGVELCLTGTTGPADRGLSRAEAHLVDAPEGAPCRWRTGRLETADGELAAGVFLLWLPSRLPEGTCADLDAGTEPAGVILGRLPGGMRREQRRAVAIDVIDETTGEDASVMSRAVLVAGGQAVGIAEENFMAAFTEGLA